MKVTNLMDIAITLGQIQNFQHEQRLLEIAHWLDQNNFSCTMVIVDGLAHYDITTHKDQPMGLKHNKNLKEHAFETVIKALSEKLSEV